MANYPYITDIPGIKIGHAQNYEALTGCTVILCEKGAVAGVSQRGGAPGTRETDLLRPMHLVQKAHAILLSGGSAFGLDAAGGVMKYLEEKGIGVATGAAKVPIVPAAILYDLGIGDASLRPDFEMGYQACANATAEKPTEGSIGAGTGATVGKILGIGQAMKGGIGLGGIQIGKSVVLAAIAAVNAFGDIVDYKTRKILAGARSIDKKVIQIGSSGYFLDSLNFMKSGIGKGIISLATKTNTIIGVIATNVSLDKEGANLLARAASNGIALSVQPAFSMLDGDTVFALSAGSAKTDINILTAYAPYVFAEAIQNAVLKAESFANLPSARDITTEEHKEVSNGSNYR